MPGEGSAARQGVVTQPLVQKRMLIPPLHHLRDPLRHLLPSSLARQQAHFRTARGSGKVHLRAVPPLPELFPERPPLMPPTATP